MERDQVSVSWEKKRAHGSANSNYEDNIGRSRTTVKAVTNEALIKIKPVTTATIDDSCTWDPKKYYREIIFNDYSSKAKLTNVFN